MLTRYIRVRILRCLLLLLPPVLLQAEAANLNTASRGPSNADPASIESLLYFPDAVSLNPALIPVTTSEGWVSTTAISVDPVNGILKGYAGFDSPILMTGIAPSSGVVGSVSATGVVVSSSPLVPITISLDFEGSFQTDGGLPHLYFGGGLLVDTAGVMYSSGMTFYQVNGDPVVVEPFGLRIVIDGGVIVESEDPAAAPVVIGSTPDFLAGTLRVSFVANAGDSISFDASMFGSAGAGVYDETGVFPAAGSVNFLNSGRLRIELPAGASVSGDSDIWTNAVTPIPEPSTWALFSMGLCALVGVAVRRQTKKSLVVRSPKSQL